MGDNSGRKKDLESSYAIRESYTVLRSKDQYRLMHNALYIRRAVERRALKTAVSYKSVDIKFSPAAHRRLQNLGHERLPPRSVNNPFSKSKLDRFDGAQLACI